LGLLLFVGSFAGGQRLLAEEAPAFSMWVARNDLAAGTEISATDLQLVSMDLPATVAAAYATGDTSLDAAILSQPVLAGQLIPSAWTSSQAPAEGRLMSIPIESDHAVGGALRPGDVVDIYATFKRAQGEAKTILLAASVELIQTLEGSDLISGAGGLSGVTVAVSEAEAPRIAFALRTAELDVVKVLGAGTFDPSEVVTEEDL
jgi:pilus assembly protein CpaB